MNEQLTSISTTANVIQAVVDVINQLDRNCVSVPENREEIVSDIQAAINRKLGKV